MIAQLRANLFHRSAKLTRSTRRQKRNGTMKLNSIPFVLYRQFQHPKMKMARSLERRQHVVENADDEGMKINLSRNLNPNLNQNPNQNPNNKRMRKHF